MLKHNIITPIHITPSTLSTRTKAQHVIDDMLTSLKLDHLYLALISWSDLRDERYIDFIGEMTDLIRVGKVRSVGVSNFPTRELAYLHAQGIRPSCNTARISLLDTRFTTTLKSFCQMHQISLLATSTLGGGFFTERFLGLPQPSRRALTPSLSRFVGMINVWGGWSLFQELLYAMKCVADKHCVSISHVAMRWVLQMGAEGVLVGGAGYVSSNVSVFEFELDDEDLGMLQGVAIRGNDLYSILGDAGSELQGWKANL